MYVYGLTAAGRDVRGRGVADSAVSTIEHGELAAIVSRIDATPLRAKRRDLLRHSDVLQDAFSGGPVVPLRFGTMFESQEALVDDLLGARYEELVALLHRVDRLAELRVRATLNERAVLEEIVAEDPRIAALRAATRSAVTGDPRLVQLGEAVAGAVAAKKLAAADHVLRTLSGHAVDVHVDEPAAEFEAIRASFLVEQRGLAQFERAADGLARGQRERMSFDLIGPMPPHSFVSLDREGS